MATFNSNGEKPKSIIINGELHHHLKHYCRGKSLKIGGVIEDLILLYLTDPKDTQKKIDELKEKNNVLEFRQVE